MELLEKLGAFGVGIVLAVSVAGLFWKLDDAIAEVPREALARFLQRLSLEPPYPNLPEIVTDAFDRIFGEYHFSWRCFFISCLFSSLAVTALTVFYVYLDPDTLNALTGNFYIVLFIAFLAMILNLVPDYVSLMETRVVIRVMGRTQMPLVLFGFLAVDLVLTFVIFVAIGGLMYVTTAYAMIEIGLTTLDKPPPEAFVSVIFRKDTFTLGPSGLFGVFLYSTFFTSVWVWLTALGWGAIRLMAKTSPLLRFMQYLLPIEERPLRSIGEVAAVIVCLGYWAISAVTWLTSTPEAQATLSN